MEQTLAELKCLRAHVDSSCRRAWARGARHRWGRYVAIYGLVIVR